MRKDKKSPGQVFWTVSLVLSMCMLIKQEVHGQWFEHRLQVAGTHGLLDLSDELPEKNGSNVHLEINEWNCEFELFILESLRLVEEPSQREVVQVQEWVMASCNPPGSPSYEFKFSTSCQNLDGPLGLWDKKKFKDSTSIILKNPEGFVKVTLSCE